MRSLDTELSPIVPATVAKPVILSFRILRHVRVPVHEI